MIKQSKDSASNNSNLELVPPVANVNVLKRPKASSYRYLRRANDTQAFAESSRKFRKVKANTVHM
jgi:hypothetical protein